MTAPVRPSVTATEPDPLEALKALRKRDPDDPLEQLKAFQFGRGTGATREWGGPEPVGHFTGVTRAMLHGIPGGELAETALASAFPGATYRGEHERISGEAERYRKANPKLSRAASLTGAVGAGIVAAPLLPANPAAAGAVIGAADQALSADPAQSATGRALRTGAGATVGAVVGKGADMLTTAARIALAKPSAAALYDRLAKRAASAKALFGKAMSQGKQATIGTPAVQRFLALPPVKEIVDELEQTTHKGVARESPEMLDAVYKVLSDRAGQIRKGLEQVTPTRPNIGRFRAKEIADLKEEALDAMSGGQSMPGPMPAYREAVTDFAQKSAGMGGVKRGHATMRAQLTPRVPAATQLTKTTPEAFRDWTRTASPEAIEGAAEGVKGAAKRATKVNWVKPFGVPMVPVPTPAFSSASQLLRDLPTREQALITRMIQLGLIGGSTVTP